MSHHLACILEYDFFFISFKLTTESYYCLCVTSSSICLCMCVCIHTHTQTDACITGQMSILFLSNMTLFLWKANCGTGCINYVNTMYSIF